MVNTIDSSVSPKHLDEAQRYHQNERQFGRNTDDKVDRRFSTGMEDHMWTEYGFDNLDQWDSVFRFYFSDQLDLRPRREVVPEIPFSAPTRTEGEFMINQLIKSQFDSPPKILELAGPGGFIRRISSHGDSLAVTLGDGRSKNQRLEDNENNIDLIEADLLTEDGHEGTDLKGWSEVDSWLESKDIEGFDLIVSNPIGGWGNLPKDLNIYKKLLSRTTSKLNEGGIFLLRFPRTWDSTIVKHLTTRVLRESDNEFEVHVGTEGLVIKRSKSLPE